MTTFSATLCRRWSDRGDPLGSTAKRVGVGARRTGSKTRPRLSTEKSPQSSTSTRGSRKGRRRRRANSAILATLVQPFPRKLKPGRTCLGVPRLPFVSSSQSSPPVANQRDGSSKKRFEAHFKKATTTRLPMVCTSHSTLISITGYTKGAAIWSTLPSNLNRLSRDRYLGRPLIPHVATLEAVPRVPSHAPSSRT